MINTAVLVTDSDATESVLFRIHGVAGDSAEAGELVQRLIDEDNTGDILCIQRTETWVPLSQSERHIGTATTKGSKANDAPEQGRYGNVCDLGRKNKNKRAPETPHTDIDNPTGAGESTSTTSKLAKLALLIAEAEANIARIQSQIAGVESVHPDFREQYMDVYRSTATESGPLRYMDPNDPTGILYHLFHNHNNTC